MQVDDLLRGDRQRALEHLAYDGVLARGLLALAVGQSVHVEDQCLLDLSVVEQVAVALGRRSGDGRAARSPRPSTASSAAVASTGQMLTLSRPAWSGETKRPSEISSDHVGRDQRARAARRPDPARRGRRRVVNAAADECLAVRHRLGAQRQPAPSNSTLTRSPIGDRAELRHAARAPRGARRWAPGSAGSRRASRPRPAAPRTPTARGHRRRRTRRRRPAGRRSRTGSGWRSWSPPACRDRARSPRTAGRTPAPRAPHALRSPARPRSSVDTGVKARQSARARGGR